MDLPRILFGFELNSELGAIKEEFEFKYLLAIKNLIILFCKSLILCNFEEAIDSYKQLDRFLDALDHWLRHKSSTSPYQSLVLIKKQDIVLWFDPATIAFKPKWIGAVSNEEYSIYYENMLNIFSILAYFTKTGNLTFYVTRKNSLRTSLYYLVKQHSQFSDSDFVREKTSDSTNYKEALLKN